VATLLPNGKQQFSDGNGTPLAGGSVYFYIPSTTTPKDTYQDSGATILNTNPVILDASGEAIIFGSGTYRQVVYDSAGNLIWDQLTADTAVGGLAWGGTSTGTPNAQVIGASSFSQQDGQQISFIVGAALTNTGSATVAPGGGSGISVLKDTVSGPTPLTGGELVAGNVVVLLYDATRGAFHLVDAPQVTTFGGPLTAIASASTTDLGSVASHNIQVTGTTTVNSFGTSATTRNPLYQVTFAGALTLTYNATSMILPGGASISTAANDTALALYLGSGNWQVLYYIRAASNPTPRPTNAGQLQLSSSTVVKLVPFNGNLVMFPSSAIAVIPSAGISSTITSASVNGVAGQTLSATTLYYAYLWNNGSAYVIDWSTTGHATDTATGIEIKSGDATRVLIGMAYPQSGPVFADGATARLVATWYNRRPRLLSNSFTTDRTTASGTFVEINSEIRINFLTWGDAIQLAYAGTGSNSAAGGVNIISGPAIDAATSGFGYTETNQGAPGTVGNISTYCTYAPAEGFHFGTVMGRVPSGTGTWYQIGNLLTASVTA